MKTQAFYQLIRSEIMSEKRIVFVTPEGLESNFRLLSYFQLRNREENYVIFKEASESLILCFGRLLGEDGELRIIKPTKEETEEILSIINEPKVIKFIINDDKSLSTLYIINYESTEVNTS